MAPHIFSYLRKDHHNRRLSFDSLNISSDTENLVSSPKNQDLKSISGKDTPTVHTSSLLGDKPQITIIETAAPNLLQVWWLEGLACLLVVSMLAAVVATIRPYEGKPLPQLPYNLSINTLVAIYFVTLKSALAFVLSQLLGQLKWSGFERTLPLYRLAQYDDASRGPWGSLILLWSFRGRSFLASGVAIILVLATILDPFGQQIIRFYSCPTQDTTTNATVPVAHSVNIGIYCPFPNSPLTVCTLGADMQATIQVGMLQSSLSPPSVSCPTGECVFDTPYGSAGWCNRCSDVSDRLLFSTERRTSKDGQGNVTRDWRNITLPPPPAYGDLNDTASVYGYLDSNITFLNARSLLRHSSDGYLLLQFIFMDNSLGGHQSDNSWMARGYGAAECSIYPCLRKYKSKISKGNMIEETLSETADQWGLFYEPQYKPVFFIWRSPRKTIEASCLNETEIGYLKRYGYSFEDLNITTAWLKFDGTRVESPLPNDMKDTSHPGARRPIPIDIAHVRRECIYEFSRESVWSAVLYLGSVFNGAMARATIRRNMTGDGVLTIGTPYLQAISQRGDISYAALTGVVDRVTQGLTNYVRDASAAAENTEAVENSATGILFKQDTCVRVEWVWLAFPSVLVTGMLITVMATMVRVSTGGPLARQNYKTSVLPLTFYPLERQDTCTCTAGPETMSKMESEAKRLTVRLEATERGWRFQET
ncbi:hypothetical protein QBC44DRAFT_317245 [Cladorrhinum sp. PSN332]|nr:hypothetical protein QBC44DRAFT_317245 [Cladorrhinum sp. PSN332]